MHQIALNIDQYRIARQNIAGHIQSLEKSSSQKVDGSDSYIKDLSRAIADYLNMARFVRLASHDDGSPECLLNPQFLKSWKALSQRHIFEHIEEEGFQHLFVPMKLRDGAVILRMNPYCLALQRNLLSEDHDNDAAIELIDMIMDHLQEQYEILLNSFHQIKAFLLR